MGGKSNRDDVITRVGTVNKIHGSMYEVIDDETKLKIICTLNGKMRMHFIKLTLGDKVDVEISTYDLTKGRIVYRHR